MIKVKLCKIGICLSVVLLFGCNRVNRDVSKKAVLVVSFGTTFIESREKSIDAIENEVAKAFPDYDKFTAFTSQIIIDVYKDRDNIKFFNVDEAINEIYKKKYGEVLVIPTHVINGEEFDQMHEALEPFVDKFEKLIVSKPLLTDIEDYNRVVEAVVEELPKTDDKTAVVFMGHGTPHHANSAYPALDYIFKHLGYNNIYVGTVEGFPSIDSITSEIKKNEYNKILLMPLMVVAGDHAHNDMAGDESDSWKNLFKSLGYEVEVNLKGLGELPAIQKLVIEHANNSVEAEVL